MSAVGMVHEELDAETENWEKRWEKMPRLLKASGLEYLLFSGNDLGQVSTKDATAKELVSVCRLLYLVQTSFKLIGPAQIITVPNKSSL